VGCLYDRRKSSLGRESVFVDVLTERVGRCDALVALIGESWLASATRTIAEAVAPDTPSDWLNREDFSRETGDGGIGAIPAKEQTAATQRSLVPRPIGQHLEPHSTEEKDSKGTHSAAERDQIGRRKHDCERVQDAIRSHF
jgi:hypothetical protein